MARSFRLTAILDVRDRLTSRLRNAREEARRVRDEIRRVAEQNRMLERDGIRGTSSLQRGFSGLTSTIMGVAAALGAAVSAGKLLESTLGQAMKYEMAEATIGAMFGGDIQGRDDYMKMVSDRALGSPLYNEMDYVQNSKSFLAMSNDLGELEQMWNLAERLGAMDPAQGLEGAIFAMRELMSGSAVSMSTRFEMNKGVMNEIKDMSIPDQLNALDGVLADMGFGADFLTQIEDTGLAFKNQIQERFVKAFRDIGLDGLEQIKPYMKEFNELMQTPAFDEFVAKAGKAFGNGLKVFGDFVMFIVKNFDTISSILKSIGVGIAAAFAISKFMAITQAIAMMGGLGAALGALLSPIVLIAGAIAALFFAWDKNLFGMKDATSAVFGFIAPYIQKAWDGIKKVFDSGMSIFEAFQQFMKGYSGKARSILSEAFGKDAAILIIDSFENIKRAIFDVKVVFDAFMAFFSGDIEKSWDMLTQRFGKSGEHIFVAFRIIKKAFNDFIAYISPIANILKNAFMGAMAILGSFASYITGEPINAMKLLEKHFGSGIANAIMGAFSVLGTVFDNVKAIFTSFLAFIGGDATSSMQILSAQFGEGAAERIGASFEFLSTVFNGAKAIIESFFAFLSGDSSKGISILDKQFGEGTASNVIGTFSTIMDFLQQWWDGAVTLWNATIPTLINFVKVGFDFISSIIRSTMTHIVPIIQNIWNTIVTIFNTVAPILMDIVQVAWDIILRIINVVMPKILETVSNVWGEVMWAFEEVSAFLSSIMSGLSAFILVIWGAIGEGVIQAVQTIWIAVETAFMFVWNVVSLVMNTIWNIIKVFWELISGIFETISLLLQGEWGQAWDRFKETIDSVIKAIGELLGDFVAGAWKIGVDFVQGLIDGVVSLASTLIKTVSGIAESIYSLFSKDATINVKTTQTTVTPKTVKVPKQIVSRADLNRTPTTATKTPYTTGRATSRSGGLDYVPYDRFPAILHKGEQIVRAEDNTSRKGPKGKLGGQGVHIAKLADHIIIREEADIDRLADKLADKIIEAGGQGA